MASLCAAATDRFYIEDITIGPGETQLVSICLNNSIEYTAFQADLVLSEGLSVEQEDGDFVFDLTARKGNDHTISSLLRDDGAIRIIAYSLNLKSFKGNSGALVTFNLKAEDDFVGPVTIYLRNIHFTTPLGEEILFEDSSCIVDTTHDNVLRGDVDGDNVVSIADVTLLIDYLLVGNYVEIQQECADADCDGKVSIADVTALIDYLLIGMWPNKKFTVNGESFTMIRVAPGSFMMGATEEQGDDYTDREKPVHEVTLTSSYFLGETEVTQALWLAVMGTNPSKHTGDLNKPVENVTWLDCQEFITRLNALTGEHFRLPTEAEWEFAARGGNKSHGYKYAGSNNVDDVAWYTGETTHAVAMLQPNELYLYDMSGNVDEWINDYWYTYTSEPQTDPTGPESGTSHVYRGGSWYGGATASRVSCRMFRSETFQRGTLGLRLAL